MRRLVSPASRFTSREGDHVTTNDPREIGVGMLGYAFMGKAHSNAFRKIDYMTWPPPLRPRLVSIAGRNEDAVSEAAGRYGFERWTSNWRELVADPESVSSTTSARTTSTPSRRSSPRRQASTSSARSRSGVTRTRATRSGDASQ